MFVEVVDISHFLLDTVEFFTGNGRCLLHNVIGPDEGKRNSPVLLG